MSFIETVPPANLQEPCDGDTLLLSTETPEPAFHFVSSDYFRARSVTNLGQDTLSERH